MFRRLIIFGLLIAILRLPCAAQVASSRTMDSVRRDLANNPSEDKRAWLLLELALDYVLKPGEYANDLDSAILLTKQAEALNRHLQDKALEARTYFVYSNALREGGKKAEGRAYIEKALTLYRSLREPEAAGKAWFEMASYYSDNVNDRQAIQAKKNCFDSAREAFNLAGDQENEAFALRNEADCDQVLVDFKDAMNELLHALAIYKRIGNTDLQEVYDLMGIVSTSTGDYSDGVKYGLLALNTAENRHDTSLQLCTVYNRLGMEYAYLGAPDKALLTWKEALDVAKKFHALPQMLALNYNLCMENSRVGNYAAAFRYARSYEALLDGHGDRVDTLRLASALSTAYTATKDYAGAGKKVEVILALLKEYPEWRTQMDQVYPILVHYYMATGQNMQAKKYASIYLNVVINDGIKRPIAQGYEVMASVDSALGDNGAALADYKNYKKYTDSVLNESTEFQFAEKQVEYETDKKDNDIKLLRQQEEIQNTKLSQSRTTNSIVIISIALLGLLLALVYSRYRVKQRLNKELQAKQGQINEKNTVLQGLVTEKDWLVREIHHRVKNNLQIVMSLLNSQSAYLKDETAISAIRESQNRVQAIALLHRKLYQSENMTAIEMPSYIGEVADYLAENMDTGQRICFEVKVSPVALDVSQAVPVGLIINEAVTNAIKHGFPGSKKGMVRVALESMPDGYLELTVRDNGIGLPGDPNGIGLASMGMTLMKGLSKQLDGKFGLIDNDGVTVKVRFKQTKSFSVDTNRGSIWKERSL